MKYCDYGKYIYWNFVPVSFLTTVKFYIVLLVFFFCYIFQKRAYEQNLLSGIFIRILSFDGQFYFDFSFYPVVSKYYQDQKIMNYINLLLFILFTFMNILLPFYF